MSERRCALLLFGCVLLMALCGCLRSRDSCAAVELLVQYPTGLSFSPDVTLVNLEFRYDIKSTAAMVTVRGHKLSIPFETLHVRGVFRDTSAGAAIVSSSDCQCTIRELLLACLWTRRLRRTPVPLWAPT